MFLDKVQSFDEYSLFPIKSVNDWIIFKNGDYFEQSFMDSQDNFHKWLESIGGERNFFLRLFLKNFSLAAK